MLNHVTRAFAQVRADFQQDPTVAGNRHNTAESFRFNV
jgi:hypothetical protein